MLMKDSKKPTSHYKAGGKVILKCDHSISLGTLYSKIVQKQSVDCETYSNGVDDMKRSSSIRSIDHVILGGCFIVTNNKTCS